MAPHSRAEPPMDSRDYIEAQLRDCYGRVVYSHKAHEKCADILLSRLSRIKLAQIILASVTTGSFISAFFGTGDVGTAIGLVVSATLLVLNAYTKDYDLGKLAQKHRQSGADLWLIREEYLSLITDLRVGDESVENVRLRRDALLKRLHAVYAGAPSTTVRAYTEAQKALQQLEEMTFSDEEIDKLLPSRLRSTPARPDGSDQPRARVKSRRGRTRTRAE